MKLKSDLFLQTRMRVAEIKKTKLDLEATQQVWKLRKLTFSSIQSSDRMCSHINPNLTNALPGFFHQNRPPLLISDS